MREICEKNMCTACGACENICTKKTIVRTKRWDGSWYMSIDEDRCINCQLCQKVCPSSNTDIFNSPMAAFAGWSTETETHKLSASGGIATELYLNAIRNNSYFAGVYLDENFEAHYQIGHTIEDVDKFKNSKYTFSYMDYIYKEIETILKDKKSVVFIGLPCQVAAIKSYCIIKKIDTDKLLTVDLVCHGTPSPDFLKHHIQTTEKKIGKSAKLCYFRDPKSNTDRFVFALYDENGIRLYKRKVKSDDLYQIGYHSALIYRDPCYRCRYAQKQRVGDITISDYHCLGSKTKYDKSRNAVSCILVNTDKGKTLINKLHDEQHLMLFERPLIEPLEGDPQFNHPSIAPAERELFCKEYERCKNYSIAAARAFDKFRKQSIREGIIDLKMLRIKLSLLISPEEKRKVKKIIKKISRQKDL